MRNKKEVRLSPHHRFVIALHSLDGVCKTALPTGPSEKRCPKLTWEGKWDTFSSPVCGQDARNCATSSDFASIAGRFLCSPDCVAEREGFAQSHLAQVPMNTTLGDNNRCLCGLQAHS